MAHLGKDIVAGAARRRRSFDGRRWALTLGLCWAIATTPALASERSTVLVYPGLGSPQAFRVEGRVIEKRELSDARKDDDWRTNFKRSLKLWANDERKYVPVSVRLGVQTWTTTTDEEGYFAVAGAPAPDLAPGWQTLALSAEDAQAAGRLLLVPTDDTLGIVSDVDDTILVSDVTDRWKLLRNTFLKNALQREIVSGVARFYARLLAQNPQPQAAAMIYLSASPRQIAYNIQAFLDSADFPPGVLITKKIGHEGGSEPLLDQRAYKIVHIEDLMQRLPRVRWVLVGDDGEKDPESYHEIQARYPDRVAAVYIRRVSKDSARQRFANQQDLMTAVQAAVE